tara:strand:+ start:865 stop:1047 length:183 start_codon:yes stop_codon:yes gene_type:complete
MKNHPESEVPDLEKLLDNIDRFFGDRVDDAAEQNTQNKTESQIQRNSNTSSERVHAPRNR